MQHECGISVKLVSVVLNLEARGVHFMEVSNAEREFASFKVHSTADVMYCSESVQWDACYTNSSYIILLTEST